MEGHSQTTSQMSALPAKRTCTRRRELKICSCQYHFAPSKHPILPNLQRKCKGFARRVKCILPIINALQYPLQFCIFATQKTQKTTEEWQDKKQKPPAHLRVGVLYRGMPLVSWRGYHPVLSQPAARYHWKSRKFSFHPWGVYFSWGRKMERAA